MEEDVMSHSTVLRVFEVRPAHMICDPRIIVGIGDKENIVRLNSTKDQPILPDDNVREIYSQEVPQGLDIFFQKVMLGDSVLIALFWLMGASYEAAEAVRAKRLLEMTVDAK